MGRSSVPARWSLRVGLAWLLVVVGAAWYLGREDVLMPGLVIGLVFVISLALGAALMAEHRRWLLVVVAGFGGGLVATLVFSMSIFSRPNGLDSYYPQFVFVEFSGFLLVPLAIGAILGLRARRTRLVGLGILTCATVAAAVTLTGATETPEGQLADIAVESSTPVYYAGRSFHGHDLADAVIFTQDAESGSDTDRSFDPGDRLDVGYGRTCGSFTGEICGDVLDIQMHRGRFPQPSDCILRVEGPRGTLLMREGFGSWVAFTGDLTLRVEDISREDMVDLVNALRPAGDRAAQSGGELPPPSADARRLVQDSCLEAELAESGGRTR